MNLESGTSAAREPNLNGPPEPALRDLELEVLEFFVRGAQLLGLPRSIGEIYGLLYLSPEPLSMDQIVERLQISVGSASQGLKQLRGFRAVRTIYVPGQRKDHFVAEQEIRKVISGFIKEEIHPHIDSGRERLDRMESLLGALNGDTDKEHYTALTNNNTLNSNRIGHISIRVFFDDDFYRFHD